MKLKVVLSLTIFLYCLSLTLCAEKDSSTVATNSNVSSSNTRQAGTALTVSSLISTLTSFLPTSLTGFFPAILLFGLGALLVPAFGLGMLLREGRRSDYNVQPNLAYSTHSIRNLNLPPNIQAEIAANQFRPGRESSYFQYRSAPSFESNLQEAFNSILNKLDKFVDNIVSNPTKQAKSPGRN